MSDHDTQQLPAIDTTEPAPPKPTLASLVVGRLAWIEAATNRTGDNLNDVYLKLTQAIAQVKVMLFWAIATLAFLSLAVLACLVFEAILVGHVR